MTTTTSTVERQQVTEPGRESFSTPRLARNPGVTLPPHAPAPAPYMVQAPQQPYVVQAPQQKGGKVESAFLGLIVLVLAVIAGFAGYWFAKDAAPKPQEFAAYQSIAAREGYFAGRNNGYSQGRVRGIAENRTIAKYKGLIAHARTYNRANRMGRRQGAAAYRNYRPYAGGYGYSGYRNRSYGNYYGGSSYGQVSSALASAQSLANATGSPVDVEIY